MNRNTIAAIDEFIKTFLRNVHARDPAARAALDERLREGAALRLEVDWVVSGPLAARLLMVGLDGAVVELATIDAGASPKGR
ncbi:MAG: hypothetical protein ABS56_02715 [Lautropia sp. SCN 69-89]|nr:MAG: hypothetical protein ABS56_02715 [Lautropia sp. SCN 69-89]